MAVNVLCAAPNWSMLEARSVFGHGWVQDMGLKRSLLCISVFGIHQVPKVVFNQKWWRVLSALQLFNWVSWRSSFPI